MSGFTSYNYGAYSFIKSSNLEHAVLETTNTLNSALVPVFISSSELVGLTDVTLKVPPNFCVRVEAVESPIPMPEVSVVDWLLPTYWKVLYMLERYFFASKPVPSSSIVVLRYPNPSL